LQKQGNIRIDLLHWCLRTGGQNCYSNYGMLGRVFMFVLFLFIVIRRIQLTA